MGRVLSSVVIAALAAAVIGIGSTRDPDLRWPGLERPSRFEQLPCGPRVAIGPVITKRRSDSEAQAALDALRRRVTEMQPREDALQFVVPRVDFATPSGADLYRLRARAVTEVDRAVVVADLDACHQ